MTNTVDHYNQPLPCPAPRKMDLSDLIDLIDIALQLSIRLRHAEAASHLYCAFDILRPAEEDDAER